MPSIVQLLVLSGAIAISQAFAQEPYTWSSQGAQWFPAKDGESRMQENHAAATQPSTLAERAESSCSLRIPDLSPGSASTSRTSDSMNAPIAYEPLSPKCKFHLVLQETYSPYTFASAGFQSTLDQAEGRWPHYGGGIQGWGKRFGADLADAESRRFIQGFALSTLFHQDPRYFPSYKRSLASRTWYAATRVLFVRKDNGDFTFNTSEFLGALLASAVQNSYYPSHDRTFADTMNRYSSALGSDAISNLLREFTPDMKRFFRKHAPKDIQKIERKLPIPAADKP